MCRPGAGDSEVLLAAAIHTWIVTRVPRGSLAGYNPQLVMAFIVATYNVLASTYIRPQRYSRTPSMLLHPLYRISAVTDHVRRLGADIVCLQEVEDDMFGALSAGLRESNFVGHLTKKVQGKADGCATFIRTSSVGWIRSVPLIYDDAAPGQPTSGHVAQIVVLNVDQRLLGIANTHLKWDPPNTPQDDQFGYRQVSQLLQQRHTLAPECSGWIICGDLNTTVGSGPVDALTKAAFDFTHRAWSDAATCVADKKARMIDYLFFDGALRAKALPLPHVTDETPLPSAEEPSDHVAVRAIFEWQTAAV